MVPPPMIPVLLAQPDDVLSAIEFQRDFIQSDYTFSHPLVTINPIHLEVIRKPLTRQLGTLIEYIMEEISAGFDEFWGLNTEEWKEVIVYSDMMKIITRATNRILVGPTLCKWAWECSRSRAGLM